MTTQELDTIKERHDLFSKARERAPQSLSKCAWLLASLLPVCLSYTDQITILKKRLPVVAGPQEALEIALKFMHRARFTDSKLKEVTDQMMALEKLLYLS